MATGLLAPMRNGETNDWIIFETDGDITPLDGLSNRGRVERDARQLIEDMIDNSVVARSRPRILHREAGLAVRMDNQGAFERDQVTYANIQIQPNRPNVRETYAAAFYQSGVEFGSVWIQRALTESLKSGHKVWVKRLTPVKTPSPTLRRRGGRRDSAKGAAARRPYTRSQSKTEGECSNVIALQN